MQHPGSESDGVLVPGALLEGRYRIASVASRTATDVVFNALDERSRQRVRVRATPHPLAPELALVRHPAIAGVVRHGRVREGARAVSYVVLEWFDGAPCTLPERPLADPASVRAWAVAVVDLLDGLDAAHRAGRPHGALGLHSLWEGRDGRLRIVDLAAPDATLAPEGVPWASPERLRGAGYDLRADVYSVGALAWALATGSPPFGDVPAVARVGHLTRRVPEHPAIPARFLAILRTAMEKQPHHRFASAARFRAALAEAIRELDAELAAQADAPGEAPIAPATDSDLEGTIDPTPARSDPGRPRPPSRRRTPPAVRLLVASGGLALSVFTWAALLGLLAAVLSGRVSWPL